MINVLNEEPVFFIMAIAGSCLFVVKLVLLLTLGDGDGELDVDASAVDSSGHIDGSASFSLVSIQSILAFFMGTGWAGLAARREWGFGTLSSFAIAAIFGFAMMALSSFLTMKIKGLNRDVKFDMKSVVGTTGIAYSIIPPKGQGIGQAEIAVNGKKQIMQAISVGAEIKSFTPIRVVDVDDSENLLVELS